MSLPFFKSKEPTGADPYQQYFKLFARISKAIHSGTNTREVLKSIVDHLTDILRAKGCIFWILNSSEEQIETKISSGFHYQSLAQVNYATLMTIFDREPVVFIEDARNDPRIPDLERLGKKRVGSVTGRFFSIDGAFRGLLAVYFTGKKRLAPMELELVTALGEQGAIALSRTISGDQEMVETLGQIVAGFVLALEAKDEQTHGHSIRVAEFAKRVAAKMGLDAREVETVFHAGLLHDIGKIGMDDAILGRLGALSLGDLDRIKKHPVIGARIIKPLRFLDELGPLILNHHERFDGSGYPEGKRGEAIPHGARILAVCDAFETMLSGRSHLERLDLYDAVIHLQHQAGLGFDPAVIQALFRVLEDDPALIDAKGAVEQCLKVLQRDITPIAQENLLKQQMLLHTF
ncbi:MAG: HD domain-containing protein [Desulfobacterium sp.]|nr:HD domain-containing protein [Desulfobacterium sp.]